MPIEQLNPEVWKLVGRMDGLWSRNGDENFGWGTVPTQPQTLTANANLGVYKLVYGDQSLTKDYYLVAGDVFHGVQGSPQDPASNWVSVGYYANYMSLKLTTQSVDGKVFTFGPNSSVETANIGFSIGGSLGVDGNAVDGPGAQAGFNAAVSISFSASEVSFRASPARDSVEWYTRLPHVGWISPSVPPNPGISSYGGYLWNPAVIFEVAQNQPLLVTGSLEVDFEYNWTRGIRRRWFTPKLNLAYHPDGVPATTAKFAEHLPTILERLRNMAASPGQLGETDTFLSILERLGLAASFGDSTLDQLVVAPTNAAVESYFSAHPDLALQWSGVQASRWWNEWMQRRISNMPPGGAANPSILASVRRGLTETDRVYACSDGLLVVTDDYLRADNLVSGMAQLAPA